jgi:putative flippase GtrA
MQLLKQFVTFFGVGVAATCLDWGLFLAQTWGLGAPEVIAALISYCCGGVLSYTLNRTVTFDTERSHMEAGWRFAVVMAVGFSLTGLFMWLFVQKLGLNGMMSRVLATAIVFFWNYAAHKLWTFAENKKAT